MKFKDIFKYIGQMGFILRIFSATEMYEITVENFDDRIESKIYSKFGDLPLRSVKALKDKLVISLDWNY